MNVKSRARDHTTSQISGRRWSRQIRVGSNYQTPGNSFAPSAPGLSQAAGAPPDWVGAWDFSFSSLKAPLQVSARDAMDVGNRAMVGARLSERPSSWWNIKAMDVNPVDAVLSNEGQTITYPGLWDGCDLVFDVLPLRLTKRIVIHDKDIAPAYFEFSIHHAPSHTLTVANDTLDLSEDGVSRLRTDPPWGKDSATLGPGPDGTNAIHVTLTEQSPVAGRPVVRLTPDPVAMASAIGAVTLDPTTVISGSSSLEDNWLRSGASADRNYGGDSYVFFSQAAGVRGLIRILTSALPAGTYNSADLDYYTSVGTTENYIGYRVLPGNDWVAGTATGAAQTGSSCHNYAKYATQSWLGSAGCATSGTDYDAATSISMYSTLSPGWWTRTFAAAGVANFQAWHDGTYANEGFVIGGPGSDTGWARMDSQEGTNPWYITIDYTEPSAGAPYYYRMINSMRK